MQEVFLSLGSNLHQKGEYLNFAIDQMQQSNCKLLQQSSVYESPAWGFHSEHLFWNQVIEIQTDLSPDNLLNLIQSIEQAAGRIRNKQGYQNRELDVDILFYGKTVLQTNHLNIPHPLLQERLFVLLPLNEIAEDFIHPVLRKSVRYLLENCIDTSPLKRISSIRH